MNQTTNSELLKTIRIPKKLHYLTDRLPKPNYDNLSDPGYSIETSPQMERNYKGSLPKLKKMLQPGLSAKVPEKKRRSPN